MKMMTRVAAACVASALLAGTASAADMSPMAAGRTVAAQHHRHGGYGMRHSRRRPSLLGFGHRSTAAGRAEQRHRTRLDRCNNVPSRC